MTTMDIARCYTMLNVELTGISMVSVVSGGYDNLMIRYSSIEWLKDMTSCPA